MKNCNFNKMQKFTQIIRARRQGGIEQVAYHYASSLSQYWNGRFTTIVDGPTALRDKFSKVGPVIHAPGICNPIKWWKCKSFRLALTELRSSDGVILHTDIGRHVVKLAELGRARIARVGVGHNDSRIRNHKHYDHIIAINSTQFAKLSEHKPASSLHMIRNPLSVEDHPVDLNKLAFGRAEKTNFVIGILANLIPKKNISHGIDQFKKLIDSGIPSISIYDGPPQLWIYGDGPLGEELKAYATASGVGDLISFKGFVEDRSAIFSSLDALWSPSLIEPFGLVMTEALYFGCPVFATPTDGSIEIRSVAPSLVICGGSVDQDLAEATLNHFQNYQTAEARLDFSRKVHFEALNEFGYARTANRLEKLFEHISGI